MIKVIVIAPLGKMGRLLVKTAEEAQDMSLAGAVGPAGRDYIGQDVGIAAGLGKSTGALVWDDLEADLSGTPLIEACDAVIDFSTVELSMEVLHTCRTHGIPLVCGTTGFTEEQEEAFRDASTVIPVFKSSNTSYVTNVLRKLVGEAAAALDGKCKVEIIDYHDEKKRDAPSGTAKEFAADVAAHSSQRKEDITFHSIRAGDISSVHTILFGCMGERLELTHRAYNWNCYAIGACEAARWLVGKPAGYYTMEDVIG